jgi:hypothetical protein
MSVSGFDPASASTGTGITEHERGNQAGSEEGRPESGVVSPEIGEGGG